jgi:fumarate reductase iron-sulfur subunit
MKDQPMADKTITLEVFRYHPEKDADGHFQMYTVPYKDDWVVLDALNWIKDQQDGTLTYRWSCRMGVCGSCGMMVNGEPKLTCAAFLKNYSGPVRVEPLTNFPVIRDLVVNIDDFMHKLEAVKAWLIPRQNLAMADVVPEVQKTGISTGEYLQQPEELARYKQFSMCINCMLCYAACPVYGMEPEFIGPAAIALAQRYNLDSRDGAAAERTEHIFSHEGIWECTFVGECTKVCPKHVDPAGAIQQAKVEATKQWWLGWIMPKAKA